MNVNDYLTPDNEPWSRRFWAKLVKRLAPFFDLGSWVLFAASLVPLYCFAPTMVVTLVQWAVFALALAGVAIGLCRIALPMVDLGRVYRAAVVDKSTPAAIVFAAVALLLGVFFIGMVLWASK